MITPEQLRILKEQAKITADKYIPRPHIAAARKAERLKKAIRDDRYAIDEEAERGDAIKARLTALRASIDDDDIPF